MRRLRIWAAGTAVVVALGLPAPVSAGGGSFVIANTASNFAEPVPRGSLLSLFTDRPVTTEAGKFLPWVRETPDGGLVVMAGCTSLRNLALPIVAVGPSGRGTRIDVYYPNAIGDEPFGLCDMEGTAMVVVQPAGGFGPPMEQPVVTVNGHPGIFAIGPYPDGSHLNGLTGKATTLEVCVEVPQTCPVRTEGQPAKLVLRLTGAEMFTCAFPCSSTGIIFALAPVDDMGNVGDYEQQTLLSLTSIGIGVEEATLLLGTNLEGGEYRLKVSQMARSEFADPLTVHLGPPN